MDRRTFVHRAAATAAGFGILRNIQGCAPPTVVIPPTLLPGTFTELRDRFFLYHLERNPVTSTYLGGDGYSPTLADSNARLRDYRPPAIEAELRFYRDVLAATTRIPVTTLAPRDRADHQLMSAQLGFLVRQLGVLRNH
ncbi:MAG: hypothetical protein ABIR58_01235, partial [Gemmatimonadaceae bacterium]